MFNVIHHFPATFVFFFFALLMLCSSPQTFAWFPVVPVSNMRKKKIPCCTTPPSLITYVTHVPPLLLTIINIHMADKLMASNADEKTNVSSIFMLSWHHSMHHMYVATHRLFMNTGITNRQVRGKGCDMSIGRGHLSDKAASWKEKDKMYKLQFVDKMVWLQHLAQFVGGTKAGACWKKNWEGKVLGSSWFGWAGLTSCQILLTIPPADKKVDDRDVLPKAGAIFCYIISLFQFALVICFLFLLFIFSNHVSHSCFLFAQGIYKPFYPWILVCSYELSLTMIHD